MSNTQHREPKPYPWWLKGALKMREAGYTGKEIHAVYHQFAALGTIRNYMSAWLRAEAGIEEEPKVKVPKYASAKPNLKIVKTTKPRKAA